jgi:hypothetical protein
MKIVDTTKLEKKEDLKILMKAVRKVLQYGNFSTTQDQQKHPLLAQIYETIEKVHKMIEVKAPTSTDKVKQIHKKSLLHAFQKSETKLLCAFIRACGDKIDLFANESSFLLNNKMLDYISKKPYTFVLISEYIHSLRTQQEKLKLVLPHAMKILLNTCNVQDTEEQSTKTGDIELALECMNRIVDIVGVDFKEYYSNTMEKMFHLLENCLTAVGKPVLGTIQRTFMKLKDVSKFFYNNVSF